MRIFPRRDWVARLEPSLHVLTSFVLAGFAPPATLDEIERELEAIGAERFKVSELFLDR